MKTPAAFVAAGLALAPTYALADPIILDGLFIKIGLNDAGTLGVGGNTRPGILYDGTGSGTFNPNYDYLTPGTPFEGFSITGNTTTGFSFVNNNSSLYSSPKGSLISYSGVAYDGATYANRAVWTGTYGSDFKVINDYFFNDSDQQLSIKTTITALNEISDLAFSRQIDPDAVAAPGDYSSTNNFRGAEGIPASDLVYAEALASKYVIGLYTNSLITHNSAVTSWTTDTASYLAGTNIGNGDNVIGLGFNIGRLAVGESATLNYSYIFGTNIRAAVDASPPPVPVATSITTTATTDELSAGRVLPVFDGGTLHASGTSTLATDLTLNTGGGTISTDGYAVTASGIISGTGELTKTGTGTLALSGGNTYTGQTVISEGTLALAGDGSLAASSGVTANGIFDIAGHTGPATIQTLDGTGTVMLGGNDLVLSNAADRFDGTLSGTGDVTVAGGTQVFTGANSFGGRTVVTDGAALGLAGDGSLAASSGVTANGIFDIAGHTGPATIQTLDGTGTVMLGGNDLVLSNAADRFDGTLSGTGGVTVAGGTQVFTGANSFGGRTVVADGATLIVSGGAALSDMSAIRNDGTFELLSNERVGTIEGAGAIRLTGGALTTLNDEATVYSGTISGQGGLIKTGTGTLTLSGANTMTGGLMINQGAVHVTQATNLGNGTVSIGAGMLQTGSDLIAGNAVRLNDASSVIDTMNHDVTLSGIVSGDGTLNKLGTGTLTLTGTNTQNGINVRGGTLAFTSDKALGAAGSTVTIQDNTTLRTLADMTIDHTLQVNNTKLAAFDTGAYNITMAGDILGAGIVQKTGTGMLTLTGSNSQVVIDVLGGSVLATQQSAVGAAGGDIFLRQDSRFSAGSTMDLTQRIHVTGTNAVLDTGSNTVTLLGVVDGDQCLMKQGSGRLNMVADGSNAIGACVQQGTLSFNNTFAGNVWVDPAGTVGGSGTVLGNMEVRGTLAPGNSPGRLVINGSVTQFAGSAFAVDVDGATPGIGAGHFDTVVLTGAGSIYTAAGTIAPTLRGITGNANNSFTPTIGESFAVVEAAGGVIGSYEGLTQPSIGLAPNSRFDVLYMPNAVVLTVTAASYAKLFDDSFMGNAASVGGAVDNFRPVAGLRDTSGSAAFANGLMTLTPEQLGRTLGQASGEVYADAMDTVVQSSRLVRTSVSDHLLDRATASTVRAEERQANGGLWGTVSGITQHVGQDRFGQGYQGTSTTMTLGMDKSISDDAVIGGGVSYSRSSVSADYLGSAVANSYQLLGYAQWAHEGMYANAVVGSGLDRYKVTRSVQFADNSAQLTAVPRGFSAGADLEIGARLGLGATSITPAIGIAYDLLERRSLNERGNEVALLTAGQDRRQAFQLRAGGRLATAFNLGGSLIRPYASAFVLKELADASSTITPSLYARSFTVRAVNAGDTAFRGAAGFDIDMSANISLRASYRYGDAANAHSNAYTGGISIRW
ncbi:autotransporter-associated beta strand protein [Sphingomonas aerolata]|uniref:Autotransporter-associated beta strand protein n=1 Tax=Sphingomonas aerolata TaxID=185951 RepID=A0A2T4YW21_9SPHN|nr:autotransporter outer membrane beta-barrel domain-containing protein [Sphingomonas aerolata]PTM47971.1 autotransporter-associated beta strand protein [Sphingomonas aerolata]